MANEQFVSRYRKYGEEQPYWKAGIFKIRLPFVHYKWSVPEMVQAVFMCATCLGAIPVLQEVLGVSYGVALSMVIINGFFYNLHVLLGDPVVPGWITPAIPIITAFLTDGYEMGPERTQALIAMQLILGLIFLVFGITGIGGKMVHLVPNSVKAGVLMGGGLAAHHRRDGRNRPFLDVSHLYYRGCAGGLLLPVQSHMGQPAPEIQGH